MDNDSRLLAAEREKLEQELSAAIRARAEAETVLMTAREDVRTVKLKSKEEARDVLVALRQKLRELSRATIVEQPGIKTTASEIESLARKLEPGEPERQEPTGRKQDLRAGDRIRIARVSKTGVVLGLHRGMLEIEVDGKTIKLPPNEVTLLEPLARRVGAVKTTGWGATLHEEEGPPDRLNIIGLRVDEGLFEIGRFIDHAGMNGLSTVTVIHGLGTGALKTAVTGFLKDHPLIATMRPGGPAEGGAGVTVAELKK